MANSDELFTRMCREAQDELASGKKSWKEIDTNTLILACFGMLFNNLVHKLTKPLWWFTGSVCAGVISYIVKGILGG